MIFAQHHTRGRGTFCLNPWILFRLNNRCNASLIGVLEHTKPSHRAWAYSVLEHRDLTTQRSRHQYIKSLYCKWLSFKTLWHATHRHTSILARRIGVLEHTKSSHRAWAYSVLEHRDLTTQRSRHQYIKSLYCKWLSFKTLWHATHIPPQHSPAFIVYIHVACHTSAHLIKWSQETRPLGTFYPHQLTKRVSCITLC
jgi:hypothetical protein